MYSLKYIFFCTRNVQLSTHWNIKINVNVRMFGGLSLHSDVTTSGEWKYQYSSQPIQSTFHTFHFYLATRIHSVDYAVARCLSVRLFVCHTPVLCLLDKHAPVITKFSSRKSKSILGSLLLSVPLNLLFAELKTSGHAPTLLSIGLRSSLFATTTTTSF